MGNKLRTTMLTVLIVTTAKLATTSERDFSLDMPKYAVSDHRTFTLQPQLAKDETYMDTIIARCCEAP